MTHETRSTLAEVIAAAGVRLTILGANANPYMDADPEWARAATHWRFTLRRGRQSMRGYFSQGSAHTQAPTIEDIVDCLASDAAAVENARDFADWCAELGSDPDSRRAWRTFNLCQRQAAGLKRVFGDEAYETLLWHTERR